MECKDIRKLASLMREMGLTVLDYNGDGISIRMERPAGYPAKAAPAEEISQIQEKRSEIPASEGEITVKSPMVGVFYSAPGADKEPYVQIGDEVHAGDVLCIIEAMKIMNEITAECDGIITGILAENGQVVEFNQALFRIGEAQ